MISVFDVYMTFRGTKIKKNDINMISRKDIGKVNISYKHDIYKNDMNMISIGCQHLSSLAEYTYIV